MRFHVVRFLVIMFVSTIGLSIVNAQVEDCEDPIQAPYGPDGTFNVYQACRIGLQWDLANEIANEAQFNGVTGHLADVHSKAENDFIHKLGRLRSHVWLGLTDRYGVVDGAKEGTFAWTSGKPLTYTNWNGNEPNNQNGTEDVVHLRGRDRDWNDQLSNYGEDDPVPDPEGQSLDETQGRVRSFNYVIEYPTESVEPVPDVPVAPRQPLLTRGLTVYYHFDSIEEGEEGMIFEDGSGTGFHGLIALGAGDHNDDGLDDIRLDFDEKAGGPASVRFDTDPTADNDGIVANPDYIAICDPLNNELHNTLDDGRNCWGAGSGTRDRLREIPRTGFTMAMWAKLDDASGDNSLYQSWALDESGDTDGGFNHTAVEDGNVLFSLSGDRADEGIMDYRGQSIASGEWFHVAATYQLDVSEFSNSPPPAPGSWIFYLNGEQVSSGEADGDVAGTVDEVLGSWTQGGFLGLSPDNTDQLSGWLDEFYLFKRGLSAEEIGILYTGGATPAGCDVNGDGTCDASDIDEMSQMVLDGTKTKADRDSLIESPSPDGFNTYIGDSDLNGQFDEQDIVAGFTAGKYLTGDAAGWAEGDWDGNLAFDDQDFVAAFIAGGYLQGTRGATAAVPEPSSLVLLSLGLLMIRRRR